MGRSRLVVVLASVSLFASMLDGAVQSVAASSGNAGLHVTKTVDATTITPDLSAALGVDKPDAIPGEALTYTAHLDNSGSLFELDGTFAAQTTAATPATLAYYWDEVDYCSTGCGNGDANPHWLPLIGFVNAAASYDPVEPPLTSSGLDLGVTSVPANGVTYPASGDQILGTVINPKATARWKYRGKATLSPDQIALLADPMQVQGLRNIIHFEVTPREANAAQPFEDRVLFSNPFQSAADPGGVTNITVSFSLADGSVQSIGPSTVQSLSSLKPGQNAVVQATFKVAVTSAKTRDESDDAYFARLSAVDGSQLRAFATATGTGFGGATISAASNSVTTTEHLPIVTIHKSGPSQLDAGSVETNPLALQNRGSAPASGLSVADTLPGGATGTVSGVPATLAAGASAAAQATYAVPPSQPGGGLTDTAAVTWHDANSHLYGPVSSSFTTTVNNALLGARLSLGPLGPNNNVTGTSQTLEAQLVDRTGKPIANQAIGISTTGANTASSGGQTDATGHFTMSYVGSHSGADRASAVVTSGSLKVYSNTVIVGWLTPPPAGVTTVVDGNFFAEPSTATTFVAKPGDVPAFKDSFPNVNFNPPTGFSPHVWNYMQSSGMTHDPTTYTTLSLYQVGTGNSPQLQIWNASPDGLPAVAFNPTNQVLSPVPGIAIPPAKFDMHPGQNSLAVVAWTSPVTDHVAISGGFTSFDPSCGSGIVWSVDKGATTLDSGSYGQGGSASLASGTGGSSLADLSVTTGDTVYFTVGPNPVYFCDSTGLEVTIRARSGANWDLARDFHTPNNEVDPYSAPFADVTTDVSGKPTGTIPAQGNGKQAGVGGMTSFDADLTGEYLAPAAGDVTFDFYVGDGFIFGLGNGASRVSGVYENLPQPATTPFKGYPVAGAFNQVDSSGAHSRRVTVHFPAAGTYPYEIDYFSTGAVRTLVLTVAQQVKDTTPFSVHVAYADGARPAGSIFPFPWLGSPNVVFVGCVTSNCLYDAGAIRIDNNTGTAQTVNSLTVDFGTCHYDIWPKNTVVPPGNLAIFSQMTTAGPATAGCDNLSGTFDTSDIPITCSPTGIIPQINLVIDGAAYTYSDTTQVLNTGLDPLSWTGQRNAIVAQDFTSSN